MRQDIPVNGMISFGIYSIIATVSYGFYKTTKEPSQYKDAD